MRRIILGATITMLLVNSATAQKKADVFLSGQNSADAIALITGKGGNTTSVGWSALAHGSNAACANCHTGQLAKLNEYLRFDTAFRPDAQPNPLASSVYGQVKDHVMGSWRYHHQVPDYLQAQLVWPQPTAAAVLEEPSPATRSMLNLPKNSGIIVRGVCEPQTKKLAGLKKNDVVLLINEKPATTIHEVDAALVNDQQLALVVLRNGRKKELKREPKKADSDKRYLVGVTLGELDPVVRSQLDLDDKIAVFVRDIAEDGAAKEAGVKPHDIFVKINGEPVPTVESVRSVVQQSKGNPIKLDLRRGDELVKLHLKPRLTGEFQAVLVEGSEHTIRLVDKIEEPVVKGLRSPADLQQRLNDIDKKLNELMAIMKSLKSEK